MNGRARGVLLLLLLTLSRVAPVSAETFTNVLNGVTTNGGANFYVGNDGAFNVLILTNSAILTNGTGTIGSSSISSNNSAIVSGAGSVWSNVNLYVGFSGSRNSLAIQNSGLVQDSHGTIGDSTFSSYNAVMVNGAGSVWSNASSLDVGVGGPGNSLVIQNGGLVEDGGATYIGHQASSSNNAVVVNGAGSVWNNASHLFVGNSGSSNSLSIQNGSLVSIGGVSFIGYGVSSSNNAVVVTGTGSIWSNGNILYVGRQGASNSLTVTGGGTVIATGLFVGALGPSFGNVLSVNGGNVLVTNSVGGGALDFRRGTLALNSGTVTVNNLYATNGASSVIAFSGGTLNSGGSTISNGVRFIVGDSTNVATLNLAGGTHYFANGVTIASNSFLTGAGTLLGSATNFGTIAPGNSPGTLVFSNDLVLASSSVLDMQLGGTNFGDYDRILISSNFSVNGTLTVSLINGFVPQKGALFDLFDYGSVAGSFTQFNLPVVQYAGTDWDTSHLLAPISDPLSGSITFVPEPSSWALLLAGGGAMLMVGRRRFHHASRRLAGASQPSTGLRQASAGASESFAEASPTFAKPSQSFAGASQLSAGTSQPSAETSRRSAGASQSSAGAIIRPVCNRQ